jgi:hypothetical protein
MVEKRSSTKRVINIKSQQELTVGNFVGDFVGAVVTFTNALGKKDEQED